MEIENDYTKWIDGVVGDYDTNYDLYNCLNQRESSTYFTFKDKQGKKKDEYHIQENGSDYLFITNSEDDLGDAVEHLEKEYMDGDADGYYGFHYALENSKD
jgi:hypothetical protein